MRKSITCSRAGESSFAQVNFWCFLISVLVAATSLHFTRIDLAWLPCKIRQTKIKTEQIKSRLPLASFPLTPLSIFHTLRLNIESRGKTRSECCETTITHSFLSSLISLLYYLKVIDSIVMPCFRSVAFYLRNASLLEATTRVWSQDNKEDQPKNGDGNNRDWNWWPSK